LLVLSLSGLRFKTINLKKNIFFYLSLVSLVITGGFTPWPYQSRKNIRAAKGKS